MRRESIVQRERGDSRTVIKKDETQNPSSLENIGVAVLATVAPGIVLAHGLATVLRAVSGSSAAPHVFAVALAVAGAGVVHAFVSRCGERAPRRLWMLGPAVSGLALWVSVGSWEEGVTVILSATAQGLGAGRLMQILPATLSGALRRRPLVAILWTLLALLAGRLVLDDPGSVVCGTHVRIDVYLCS
jgi:chromate transport protein ChrA